MHCQYKDEMVVTSAFCHNDGNLYISVFILTHKELFQLISNDISYHEILQNLKTRSG